MKNIVAKNKNDLFQIYFVLVEDFCWKYIYGQ